jgi:hypothetical protein
MMSALAPAQMTKDQSSAQATTACHVWYVFFVLAVVRQVRGCKREIALEAF